MKRFYIFTLFFVWALVLWAQPQMKFDKQTCTHGSVLWANPVTATFRVSNDGNAPLVINEVKSSCACTVVEWPKRPIDSGQTAQIVAVFDAKALGQFYKEIEVHSNASADPVYLQMEGKVVASGKDLVKDALRPKALKLGR